MRWEGTKKYKELITEDGYYLKVQFIEESKYSWIVLRNGEIVERAITEQDYGTSMQTAKAKAKLSMVRNLKIGKTNS